MTSDEVRELIRQSLSKFQNSQPVIPAKAIEMTERETQERILFLREQARLLNETRS